MRIGFLINPIAGMGGRVGLKGTDNVVEEAVRLGARPVAPARAAQTLNRLRDLLRREAERPDAEWLTCSGAMGEEALRAAGFDKVSIVHEAAVTPSSRDTCEAVRAFLAANADLILFCGGDGTARDVAGVTGEKIPIVGIPSGVKMYSGVFGVSTARTAEIVAGFVKGDLTPANVDIIDLDEAQYREGKWAVRLFCSVTTPYEPTYTQAAKALISERADAAVKAEIADYLQEEIASRPGTLFFLGPGSTVRAIADYLGVKKTLLGIDALLGGSTVGCDLNEKGMLALLEDHPTAELILSPIGAQGFVLGRGNLQISPEVVRRIGPDRLTIVATPAKLRRTSQLRFDTGERTLDEEFAARAYFPIVTGYRRRRMVPVSI